MQLQLYDWSVFIPTKCHTWIALQNESTQWHRWKFHFLHYVLQIKLWASSPLHCNQHIKDTVFRSRVKSSCHTSFIRSKKGSEDELHSTISYYTFYIKTYTFFRQIIWIHKHCIYHILSFSSVVVDDFVSVDIICLS